MGASPSALPAAPGAGEEGSRGVRGGWGRSRGGPGAAEGPSSLLSGLPAEIHLCEQTRWSEGR